MTWLQEAASIRREVIAWLVAGVFLHHCWLHGIDHWSLLLAMSALGIHPAPARLARPDGHPKT
jgi:hypothetical protein